MLITDKVDFRKSKLIRIKEGHFITINNLTFQDYIIVLSMFALNSVIMNETKTIKLQGETDKSAIWLGI